MKHRILWVIIACLFAVFITCWKGFAMHDYEDEIESNLEADNIPAAAMLLTKWSKHGGYKDPKYFHCFASLESKLGHPEGVAFNLHQASLLEGK